MKCLLCDNSERILQFVKVYPDYKEFIGFSLTEFVKYDSKEKYITKISERLSSKILAGEPSKVVKRLKCLIHFENINTTLLDDLMAKRNNIVHEGQMFIIELDTLEAYYVEIENLLTVLASALKNINISVIDYGGLLNKE